MDDDSRFRWSITAGIAIALSLLLAWLYAPRFLKAVTVGAFLGASFLLRFLLLGEDWSRVKARGKVREVRALKIFFVGLIVSLAVLVALMVFRDPVGGTFGR
jgi:uncharacterized membrane protein